MSSELKKSGDWNPLTNYGLEMSYFLEFCGEINEIYLKQVASYLSASKSPIFYGIMCMALKKLPTTYQPIMIVLKLLAANEQ